MLYIKISLTLRYLIVTSEYLRLISGGDTPHIFPQIYSEYLDIPYPTERRRQFRRTIIKLYKRAIIRKGRTCVSSPIYESVGSSERTRSEGSPRVPGDVASPLIILTRGQTARNYGDGCFTVSRRLRRNSIFVDSASRMRQVMRASRDTVTELMQRSARAVDTFTYGSVIATNNKQDRDKLKSLRSSFREMIYENVKKSAEYSVAYIALIII